MDNQIKPCNNYERKFHTIAAFEDHSNHKHPMNNDKVCGVYKAHFHTFSDYEKPAPQEQKGIIH